MIDFNSSITRKAKVIEAALWTGAGLVTFGLHAGAAALMLSANPVVAADNSPPAAIMIEIAAAPEAVQTAKDEITPDRTSAEESVPEPDRKAEETPPQQPVEQVVKEDVPTENEKVSEKTVLQNKAEVQLPAEQPKPEKKELKEKPNQKKPEARRQQATADSRIAREAQVQVRQSDRVAAAETASGLASMSPANWQSLLMAHLQRRKPSNAKEQSVRGITYVSFTIDAAGNVLSASIARSSGFAEFDRESLAMVYRASPVPPPPAGTRKSITVPVRFNIN